jgi:hypothetical protein
MRCRKTGPLASDDREAKVDYHNEYEEFVEMLTTFVDRLELASEA